MLDLQICKSSTEAYYRDSYYDVHHTRTCPALYTNMMHPRSSDAVVPGISFVLFLYSVSRSSGWDGIEDCHMSQSRRLICMETSYLALYASLCFVSRLTTLYNQRGMMLMQVFTVPALSINRTHETRRYIAVLCIYKQRGRDLLEIRLLDSTSDSWVDSFMCSNQKVLEYRTGFWVRRGQQSWFCKSKEMSLDYKDLCKHTCRSVRVLTSADQVRTVLAAFRRNACSKATSWSWSNLPLCEKWPAPISHLNKSIFLSVFKSLSFAVYFAGSQYATLQQGTNWGMQGQCFLSRQLKVHAGRKTSMVSNPTANSL